MDQYRSRLKLSENFERHWSIRISGEIHMDQSLVHTFSWGNLYGPMVLKVLLKFPPYTGIGPWMALPSLLPIGGRWPLWGWGAGRLEGIVAHDCGYPLSRYTCRATRVAADFLDFIAFCRCSTGVALHPLKILVSHLPPPCAGRCRTEIWLSEKVSRYTGVSQLQLRVSRYTVQLALTPPPFGCEAAVLLEAPKTPKKSK